VNGLNERTGSHDRETGKDTIIDNRNPDEEHDKKSKGNSEGDRQ